MALEKVLKKKLMFLGILSIVLALILTSATVMAQDENDDDDDDDFAITEETLKEIEGEAVDGEDGTIILTYEDGEVKKATMHEGQIKEKQDSMLNNFGCIAVVSFALFSLLAGAFTAYFGAGKSRAIGGVLLAVGLVLIILFLMLAMNKMDAPIGILDWHSFEVKKAFMIVLGAIVGAAVAIGLFLVAIMKS